MLDENVPEGVAVVLRRLGHDAIRSTELIAAGSPDPLVATTAQEDDRILVTHDGDFKRIERLCSQGQQDRFPRLSRLMLSCSGPVAAERVEAFLVIIEAEYQRVQNLDDARLVIDVGERRVRIFR